MTPLIRRAVANVVAWWATRPTQRRIDRLKARRFELRARIVIESRNHRRVSHLYAQLKNVTTELLRLERRRVA